MNLDQYYSVKNTHQFEPGTTIKTESGETVKIIKLEASGKSFDIYRVEFRGEEKALKWQLQRGAFKNDKLKDSWRRMQNNMPAEMFIGPIAITEEWEGSWGFVTELLSKDYCEHADLSKPLLHRKKMTYRATLQVCMNLCRLFYTLHACGYVYQNFESGAFRLNPDTGDVIGIWDEEYVVPMGTRREFIVGDIEYRAPELWGDDKLSTIQSDLHTLAVIIFELLCDGNPFLGKRIVGKKNVNLDMVEEASRYPLFIYDPSDDSNRPIDELQMKVVGRWKVLPDFVKDTFIKAFSKETLYNPEARLKEIQWLEMLCHYRNSIAECSCGQNEVILQNNKDVRCETCGKTYPVLYQLKLPRYSVPIIKGGRIYRCQIESGTVANALEPFAAFLQKDETTFGIKNMTKNIWSGVTPNGNTKRIEPDDIVPAKAGIKLQISQSTLEIQEA